MGELEHGHMNSGVLVLDPPNMDSGSTSRSVLRHQNQLRGLLQVPPLEVGRSPQLGIARDDGRTARFSFLVSFSTVSMRSYYVAIALPSPSFTCRPLIQRLRYSVAVTRPKVVTISL
jgi:hypothetical protein